MVNIKHAQSCIQWSLPTCVVLCGARGTLGLLLLPAPILPRYSWYFACGGCCMYIVWLYKTAWSWLFTLGYEANQNVANDWHRDASDQGILCMPDRFTRFIWFSSRSCFSAAVSSLYFFHSSFCNGIRCSSKFTFPGFRAQFMFCAFFLILFIFLPSACQRRPVTLQWLHALLFFVVFFVSDDCARGGFSFCLCCPSFCSV